MTPEQKIARAGRAKELLDNELMQEVLAAIEKEVIDLWEACPSRDAQGKEALWQLYKTSKKFRNILAGYIATGELETENLKRYEEQSRLKRMFRVA